MTTDPTADAPIMTVLEARVAPPRWNELAETFRQAGTHLPPQMLHSFVVQSAADPVIWRVVSVWRSRAALDEYRQSVETPGGVLMFRSVGAEPTLTIWNVAAAASPDHDS